MATNVISIKNVILDFINNPDYFEDPYEVATQLTRRGASNQLVWASGNDQVKVIHSPKIQVKAEGEEFEKIAGSRTKYHTQKTFTINIYYHNKKGYKYIKDSVDYSDSDQNIFIREFIQDQISAQAYLLDLHLLEFSTIDEPVWNPLTSEWTGLLKVTGKYYGNVGI